MSPTPPRDADIAADALRQFAETLRQPAPPIADLPFALTPTAARRTTVQPALRLEIAEPRD